MSGHPPGALLTFVWLDRIGLGGGTWAAVFCVLIGTSAAAAIVVATKALCGEYLARRAAPFVAVAPTAIWIAVSADGYFAGVAAWGLALLALAVSGAVRLPVVASIAAGLLLGWGIFLNYGLGLIALCWAAIARMVRASPASSWTVSPFVRSAIRNAAIWISVALPAALGGKPIELCLAAIFRFTPVGGQPSTLFQAVQRGIERALLHLEDVARDLPDAQRDAVTVDGAEGDDLEDKHVESSLQ